LGFNIAKEIIAADPTVLVIMVTGAGSEHVAAESLAVGVHGYVIKKGVETYLDVLPTTISRLLEKKRNQHPLSFENLETHDAFYQSIANFSPVAIFIYVDEVSVFVNPAATALMRANASDELIGKSAISFVHPEDQGIIRQRIEVTENSKSAVPEIEVRYRRLDGTIVYVQTIATMISFQGKRARMVMVLDITDRKRASDIEKQFRTFIENIPAAITLRDKDGNFITVNKVWAEWFKQDKDAIVGKSRLEIFGPDRTGNIQAMNDDVLQNGTILNEENSFTDATGTFRTSLMQKFPIENSNGENVAVGTIHTDISDFQKAKEEIIEARDRLDTRVHERTKSLNEQIIARENIEKALREQQSRLQGVLDSVLDGIITIGENGKILSFNKAAEGIFGYSEKEAIGIKIDRLMQDPKKTGDESYFENLKQAGKNKHIEFRQEVLGIRKTGPAFLASLAISELELDGTRLFTGIIRDITAAKGKEKELRDSERRFRSLLENYAQGILVHRDLKPIYANQAFANLYGYNSVDEIMTVHSVTVFTHTDYRRPNTDYRVYDKSAIQDRDVKGIKKDGHEFWENRRSFGIEWDGKPAVCSIRIDITDRKTNEELLKASQAKAEEEGRKLQSAIDSLHEGFAYFDADDKLTHFNTRFMDRQGKTKEIVKIGITFEEYIRARVYTDIVSEAVGREEEFVQQRMKAHLNPSGPIVVRYDEEGRWLLINETKTGDGGTVATSLDITELKETEEDLRQAMQSAEKANKAKSEFLSSMSHELRTPLNAILGFSQMLTLDPNEPLSDSQEKSVDHIMKGGSHLLNLIDDVLDLAKVEAGKIELSIEDVPIMQPLGDSITSIEAQAQLRGIDVKLESVDTEAVVIRADATRFKQVLLNLLSNGVKYNKENGSLTISTHVIEDRLRISVSDTGDGIPEDRQVELFQPFNRLGQEATLTEGTGIGLVVTKSLVEEMMGEIGFESVVGEGSTFWVEFPISKKPTIIDTLATKNEDHPTFTNLAGHILYVEDNSANVDLLEMIVSRIDGLTVTSVINAELGLDMLRSSRPDLIIMDINLPGMSGFDALVEIQNIKNVCDVPVIALSANATPRDIQKGHNAGFYDYLTKPIDVGTILNAIEKALHLKG
jgi:PAS domain S-box-containing protein